MKPSEAITDRERDSVSSSASLSLGLIEKCKHKLIRTVELGGNPDTEVDNPLYMLRISNEEGLIAYSPKTNKTQCVNTNHIHRRKVVEKFDLCADHLQKIADRLLH